MASGKPSLQLFIISWVWDIEILNKYHLLIQDSWVNKCDCHSWFPPPCHLASKRTFQWGPLQSFLANPQWPWPLGSILLHWLARHFKYFAYSPTSYLKTKAIEATNLWPLLLQWENTAALGSLWFSTDTIFMVAWNCTSCWSWDKADTRQLGCEGLRGNRLAEKQGHAPHAWGLCAAGLSTHLMRCHTFKSTGEAFNSGQISAAWAPFPQSARLWWGLNL